MGCFATPSRYTVDRLFLTPIARDMFSRTRPCQTGIPDTKTSKFAECGTTIHTNYWLDPKQWMFWSHLPSVSTWIKNWFLDRKMEAVWRFQRIPQYIYYVGLSKALLRCLTMFKTCMYLTISLSCARSAPSLTIFQPTLYADPHHHGPTTVSTVLPLYGNMWNWLITTRNQTVCWRRFRSVT